MTPDVVWRYARARGATLRTLERRAGYGRGRKARRTARRLELALVRWRRPTARQRRLRRRLAVIPVVEYVTWTVLQPLTDAEIMVLEP